MLLTACSDIIGTGRTARLAGDEGVDKVDGRLAECDIEVTPPHAVAQPPQQPRQLLVHL